MTRSSAKPVRRLRVSLPPERPDAALVRGARVPGAAVVTLLLLVFGVLVLAPGVSQYLNQRQQTADLRATVAQQQHDLNTLRAQRARWSDPAYIRAQAGSRLFYVLPGQTVYRVAGLPARPTTGARPPSATAQQTTTDWAATLYGSLVTAGTTDATTSRLRSALPQK
ncbi:septum formation initiator family protein [uncultured Amnibacterium sp.]|uniref:FtsB family cell division protein n=1 Tax=uncultured Amnibacterium sp. TaxID=1631851 RepID=UPI0035CB7D51